MFDLLGEETSGRGGWMEGDEGFSIALLGFKKFWVSGWGGEFGFEDGGEENVSPETGILACWDCNCGGWYGLDGGISWFGDNGFCIAPGGRVWWGGAWCWGTCCILCFWIC